MCVFVNFVSECAKWAKVVEDLLNDIFSSISVVQINSEMDRHEKNGSIKLSTGFLKMVGYNPRVLVATSAVNTGIDNRQLQLVHRFGLLRCPTTLLQERGRNACAPGMTGAYVIFTLRKLVPREYLLA